MEVNKKSKEVKESKESKESKKVKDLKEVKESKKSKKAKTQREITDAPISKQSWKPGNMLYPLPAVMVSCAREGEKPNIITVAWTGTICSDPVMAYISVRPERYSYNIIKETGEFVINLTTEDLARATDYCGVRSGRDHDKFTEMGLTAVQASKLEHAPLIAESPVNIECRVREVIPLGSHDMFIADVVAVNVSEKYMNETGKFELNNTGLMVYSHG